MKRLNHLPLLLCSLQNSCNFRSSFFSMFFEFHFKLLLQFNSTRTTKYCGWGPLQEQYKDSKRFIFQLTLNSTSWFSIWPERLRTRLLSWTFCSTSPLMSLKVNCIPNFSWTSVTMKQTSSRRDIKSKGSLRGALIWHAQLQSLYLSLKQYLKNHPHYHTPLSHNEVECLDIPLKVLSPAKNQLSNYNL